MTISLKRLGIGLTSLIVFVSILVLGALYLIRENTNQIEQRWNNFADQNSKRSAGLEFLVTELGYGGMIHQFKNYVIRQDEKRISRIRSAIGGANMALRIYGNSALTTEEETALQTISETISAYEAALGKAIQLAATGATPEEIDSAIKIPDGPALAAIDTMFLKLDENRIDRDNRAKAQVLIDLRRSLGYGGMIHQFKNFVLRKDTPRLDKIAIGIEAAREQMAAYQRFSLSADEKRALTAISGVVDSYAAKTQFAAKLAKDGKTASEIDVSVKIDDGPANAGFLTLSQALTQDTEVSKHALVSSLDEIQVLAPWALVIVAIALPLSAFLIGYVLLRRIISPMNAISKTMDCLAAGETDIDIPYAGRGDELGAMAASVDVFRKNLLRNREMEEEARLQALKNEEGRQAELTMLATDFEQSVGGIVEDVFSAARELSDHAGSMSAIAADTNGQMAAVTSAADEASTNVQTVAAAAEELSVSIAEVSKQITTASELSGSTATEAEATANAVRQLGEVVSKVAAVTDLIQDIAEQTNLLALNATIEAARAGDAGRGFAVVASEVKQLAEQTSRATDEIKTQIEEIQTASSSSIQAVERMTGMVQEISSSAQLIAAAAEEQGSATREIAGNATQASEGTKRVRDGVGGVNQATRETGQTSDEVKTAAETLNNQAQELRSRIEDFVANIRVA